MLKIDEVVKNLEKEGYVYFLGNYMRFHYVPKLRSAEGLLNGFGVVLGVDVLDGSLFTVDSECTDYDDLITEQYLRNIVYEYERAIKANDMNEAAFYSSLGRLHIEGDKRDFKSAFDLKAMSDRLNLEDAKEVEGE